MNIDTQARKSAWLLDDNLMSAVRVQNQLQRAGYLVYTLRELAPADESPNLVLINLGSRSLGGVEKIQTIQTQFPGAKVFGYCGHTEVELRKAAKAAGMRRIFTNEEAMIELAQLLEAGTS
jgi:DNA-binding NarL/FixJ family response regulator